MWENAEQNNSEYGHFSRSDYFSQFIIQMRRMTDYKNFEYIYVGLKYVGRVRI